MFDFPEIDCKVEYEENIGECHTGARGRFGVPEEPDSQEVHYTIQKVVFLDIDITSEFDLNKESEDPSIDVVEFLKELVLEHLKRKEQKCN
jgi:hypothetical protein